MKPLVTYIAALALGLASSTVLAFHCPADMKKIDAALAQDPALDASQMSQVKTLRARGEALHRAGSHAESVEALAEAMAILGVR